MLSKAIPSGCSSSWPCRVCSCILRHGGTQLRPSIRPLELPACTGRSTPCQYLSRLTISAPMMVPSIVRKEGFSTSDGFRAGRSLGKPATLG
jgi:hypothetical protein